MAQAVPFPAEAEGMKECRDVLPSSDLLLPPLTSAGANSESAGELEDELKTDTAAAVHYLHPLLPIFNFLLPRCWM